MPKSHTREDFIRVLPKIELHLYIEGSLEPELMFELARRNGVEIPFASADEVRAAYRFSNLQSLLDIYYPGARLLIEEQGITGTQYLTRMEIGEYSIVYP